MQPLFTDLGRHAGSIGRSVLGSLAGGLGSSTLMSDALRQAMEVRERATQLQEATLSAANLPSAADLERLARRLRSLGQRLEAIEDAVDRVDERVATATSERSQISAQLDRIEALLTQTSPT